MKYLIKVFKISLMVSLVILCFTSSSYGSIMIDRSSLEGEHGVDFKTFRLNLLSVDGTILVTTERVEDLAMRKEGKIIKLSIIKIDPKNDIIRSWNSVYFDLTNIGQVVLSDEGDKLLIIGNGGTQLLVLDTVKMTVAKVFKHEKGKPGFKSEPSGMYYDGQFYVKGYFYDKDQYSEGDYIARVDITKSGAGAFEKIVDFGAVYEKFNCTSLSSIYMVSPSSGYFSVIRPPDGKEALLAYYNETIVEIENGCYTITDIAGSSSKVIYNIKKNKDSEEETKIFDLETGKSWSLGSYIPYSFIALKNGEVVITALLNYSQLKMSFFYGKENNNFQLKPLLEDIDAGSFKLSGDGKVFAYLGSKLIIDSIK